MIRTVSLLSGLMLLLSYPAAGQEAAASREASSQLSGSQLGTLKQQTSQSDLAQEWGLNQQNGPATRRSCKAPGALTRLVLIR